jgi:hypothetical protein
MILASRETIYAALFTLVSSLYAADQSKMFKAASRRYVPFTEVPAQSQPALFQVQRREQPTQLTGLPAGWKMEVDLVIYVNSTNYDDTTVSPLMNPVIDAVAALFDTTGQVGANKQTLGGLVHYARISGAIETDEGVLGDQAFAIIPIEIFAY